MHRLLGIGLLGVFAGCATSAPPPVQTATSDGADMRCEKIYPTGSNMPKTVCTTAEDRRRQQREVDEMGERIRNAPATPMGRPGG